MKANSNYIIDYICIKNQKEILDLVLYCVFK
jgi:hypothetical protein